MKRTAFKLPTILVASLIIWSLASAFANLSLAPAEARDGTMSFRTGELVSHGIAGGYRSGYRRSSPLRRFHSGLWIENAAEAGVKLGPTAGTSDAPVPMYSEKEYSEHGTQIDLRTQLFQIADPDGTVTTMELRSAGMLDQLGQVMHVKMYD